MNAETFFDAFDLLAEAPNSVAKLRELILQLAVQGKLVPQDPREEPASRLVAKLSQRSGHDPTTGESVGLRDVSLPRGWAWVRLNQLGEICGGSTPSMQRAAYWGGNIPWISPKDMKSHHVASSELKLTKTALNETTIRLIPKNSVLIVGRSGILKRTLPVCINTVECTVNQDLKVVIPYHDKIVEYVRLMLKGFEPFILTELVKTGTTVQSLKYDEFAEQSFPIPPLAEQRRIVSKVDELLGLCDELETRQGARRELRERLVQAALDQLLASQDPADFATHWQRLQTHFDVLFDTPAAVERLRQTIHQLAVLGKLVSVGKSVPEFTHISMEELVGQKNLRNGISLKPSAVLTGFKCLSLSAVRNGVIDCSDGKPVPLTPTQAEPYLVHENEVFVVRGNGSKDFVGRAAIVRNLVDGIVFPDLLIRIPLDTKKVLADYFLIAWNSPSMRTEIERVARTTSGIWKINQGHIAGMVLPIPSISTQKAIVSRVNSLSSMCEKLDIAIKEATLVSQILVSASVQNLLIDSSRSKSSNQKQVKQQSVANRSRTVVASPYSK